MFRQVLQDLLIQFCTTLLENMQKISGSVLCREILFSLIITFFIQSCVGYPYPEDLKGQTIQAVFPDTTPISSNPQKEIQATPVSIKTSDTMIPLGSESDPYQRPPKNPNSFFNQDATMSHVSADDMSTDPFCPNFKDVRQATSGFVNDFRNNSGRNGRREVVVKSMVDVIEVIRGCLIHILRQGKTYFHNLFKPKNLEDLDLIKLFDSAQITKLSTSTQPGGNTPVSQDPNGYYEIGDSMTEPHMETSLSPIKPEPTPSNQDEIVKVKRNNTLEKQS